MDTQKNAEIIARIKYLMKEMGVRQVQFAERIGVDTSTLSKYLNAHMPLSESFLNRLVVNLGVSKEWLLDGRRSYRCPCSARRCCCRGSLSRC